VSGVCPMRVERFHGPCGDAGVEEIVGLDGPVPSGSGMGVLLGSRTATPQSWIVARFRCPCGVAGVRWARGGTCGAWRFENWIVDASKRNMVFLFAYRDFAKLFFLSLVSRSIVL